jgi:tetratricopeptide (TPR) repeat protein
LALAFTLIAAGGGLCQSEETQRQLSAADEEAFRRGTEALKTGDYAAAATAFEKVVKSDKGFAPAYLNLGLAYHSEKDYEKAIRSLSRALELDNRLSSAALLLGIDYYILNSPEKAIKFLQQALTLPGSNPQEVCLWLGRAYLAAAQYQNAVPYLEKAAQAYPEDLTVIYSLGRAHLLRSQQVLESLYQKGPRSYMTHFLLGQSYQAMEKYDAAITWYRSALKLNPSLLSAHEALGDIAVRQRKPEEAEKEFRAELQLGPYNAQVKYKLGRLLNQMGRTDEARTELQQAVQLQPSLVQARCELAKIQLRMGQPEEAVKNLEAALATDSQYAPTYLLLGQAFGKLGQQEKAQTMIQRGRALQEATLQQVRENLDAVEPTPQHP